MRLEVVPVEGGKNKAEFIRSGSQSWSDLKWFIRKPINHGVTLAFAAGPLLSYPVGSYDKPCLNVGMN